MNESSNSGTVLDEADEEVLGCNVSDEELETAMGGSKPEVTWGTTDCSYCSTKVC
jgi:hypothetical protein